MVTLYSAYALTSRRHEQALTSEEMHKIGAESARLVDKSVNGVCVSVRLSVCPPVRLSACQPVSLSVCPSVRLSVCPSVRLSVCPSVRLSVCLPACLPACLSVCLSVCLCQRKYILNSILMLPFIYSIYFVVSIIRG